MLNQGLNKQYSEYQTSVAMLKKFLFTLINGILHKKNDCTKKNVCTMLALNKVVQGSKYKYP